MDIKMMRLGDLRPYEKNPRKNDEAVKYVQESIKQFGFKVPIVIDRDFVIVAGHTRYKAAKKLDLKEVPCIVADDLTDEQIKAFRLADNKVAEKAEWDFNILSAELDELFDFDMTAFGFEDDAISSDEFSDEFTLADGDKPEICQITLTLHQKQKELIEYAMHVCMDCVVETYGNTNKNGNAIYEVVRQWAEQRK